MKINWGTGIVIAFILFISFIMYFVLKVQTDSKYDNELIVEEYYKHDTHYEDEMIKVRNAQNLSQKPLIENDSKGIEIIFPETFVPGKMKGKVSLYRASDKKLDFEMPISQSVSYLFIPKTKLVRGLWGINVEWKYNGKEYLMTEKVYCN